MKILFITPYPEGTAPSQRFRFEQYYSLLERENILYHSSSFLNRATWNVLYSKGFLFTKISALISGYLRRTLLLFSLSKYDLVFIHREAAPFGPPVFEWLISKVFKKPIVYDYDDAIWIPNSSESNNLTKWFKNFSNPGKICRMAKIVSAGNTYLADYARKFNHNVVVNPTTIDTEEHHNHIKNHHPDKFIIGWTGSHSTVQYLDLIVPVLKKLESDFDFEFHVICDTPPKFTLKSLRFIKWKKDSEIDDLLEFNVGVMPLRDDIWSKGKCGFKALQYMALGIPAVVSDVGVNSQIVDDEVNGRVCRTEKDWYDALAKMMSDHDYLKNLSKETRRKIIDHYSIASNSDNFLQLIRRAM